MEDKNLKQLEWFNQYLEKITSKARKSAIEKNILELHSTQNKTVIQERIFKRLIDNEYKRFLTEQEVNSKISRLNDKSQQILKQLTQKTPSKTARKKREHDLIVIGALTDLTGFPKDKGIVTGAFDYILNQAKDNHNFLEELKITGDKILHDRELEKIQAKVKKEQQ